MVSALGEFSVELFGCGTVLFVGGFCQVVGDVFCNYADSAVFGFLPVAVLLSFGVILVFNVCSIVEVVGA